VVCCCLHHLGSSAFWQGTEEASRHACCSSRLLWAGLVLDQLLVRAEQLLLVRVEQLLRMSPE